MGALGVEPHACVHFFLVCGWLLQSASSVKARNEKAKSKKQKNRDHFSINPRRPIIFNLGVRGLNIFPVWRCFSLF
jgi:hypothetical protein